MDGVLSQEEISALLNNPDDANKNDLLTDAEKDAIGEIGNISMGTAATTLFSLVNRKVDISTPVVSFATSKSSCNSSLLIISIRIFPFVTQPTYPTSR